jgi:hypothetical protein
MNSLPLHKIARKKRIDTFVVPIRARRRFKAPEAATSQVGVSASSSGSAMPG